MTVAFSAGRDDDFRGETGGETAASPDLLEVEILLGLEIVFRSSLFTVDFALDEVPMSSLLVRSSTNLMPVLIALATHSGIDGIRTVEILVVKKVQELH